MSEEPKRGSNGGNARAEKLTKEQRKLIASEAAKARWAKIRKAKQDASNPAADSLDYPDKTTHVCSASPEPSPQPPVTVTVPIPPPIPESRPKTKRRASLPKPFGAASSYAERRLAEAIKERAEYAGRLAALNAEIPSLIQIIKALRGTEALNVDPRAYQTIEPMQFTAPAVMPQTAAPPQTVVPPIPMAHGGAVGGPIQDQQELPEDYFLRDTVIGGKFI